MEVGCASGRRLTPAGHLPSGCHLGGRAASERRSLRDRPSARTVMTSVGSTDERRDELVERLFGSAIGAVDLLCIYLGGRLGLYRALADAGPSTSAELASAAGINERYA